MQRRKLDSKFMNTWANLGSLFCTVIQNIHEQIKVKTGDYQGHHTDELEEFGLVSFIEEFVSGCLKNYAFSVFCPSTGKLTTK